MSAPASGRFLVRVGRMTSYCAEIDAADERAAQAIAGFLIETPVLFHSVFRQEDESVEILDVTRQREAIS